MKFTRKRYNPVSIVLRIIDSLSIILAWEISYFIRFHILKDSVQGPELDIILMAPAVLVITVLLFSHNDLYTTQRYFSWYHELFAILKCHFQAVATIVVLLYFANPSRLSRVMLGIYALLTVVLSLVFRLTIRAVLMQMRIHGKNLRHVVLIGTGRKISEYARRISASPELGLRIDGWVDSRGEAEQIGVPDIASIEEIPSNGDKDSPDSLIIGYEARNYELQNKVLTYFNKTVVPVWLLPDIQQALIGYTIEDFHGVPLVKFNGNRVSLIGSVGKRFVDIVGGIIGLTLFSPLMVVIGLLVKTTSKGPIFYGQERVSLEGDRFIMWKFRSMRTDAEDSSGAVWARKNDNRTTPVGAFIRKTSIDELPQFWNVIRGDMSLVGPRPERPVLVDQFKEDIPAYMLRHKMKAGITGWAQVNGWRGDTSLVKRIEYDIYYIQHWSLWFDVKILFLTLMKGFVHPNAY